MMGFDDTDQSLRHDVITRWSVCMRPTSWSGLIMLSLSAYVILEQGA